MSPFLPVSIGALLAASLWGIVLAGRRGDPYRRLLAFVISTLAMAHASWLVGLAVAPDPQGWITELAPPVIGVLAILALFLLGRISARQRHVEQRLEVQKAYLEDLLESSTDAIVLVNREARVLRVNSAFTELFGFGSREVVGEALDEMVTFPDQLRWARAVTRRMVAGEPMEVESIRRRKDGTAIDVSVVAYPVRVPGDEAAAFVIFRDISRRVQVEAAFRRLEKAVETMQIGVTITDLDGRIVYINPAEAEMHGYAREELIGKDVRIFAVPGTAKRMTAEQIARMGT
ncbi:MAG: PAS domain S-box protein, partial [Gemmatimonadetes bacterium]|nr:PAS domain S-box protein [Gemmatimonadota bacterium]